MMEWLRRRRRARRGVEVSAPILYVSAYKDIGRGDWPCTHPRTNTKYVTSLTTRKKLGNELITNT